jgi:hypothetical protein
MVERPDPLLTRILAHETLPSNEQIMSDEGAVCASISPLAKPQPILTKTVPAGQV